LKRLYADDDDNSDWWFNAPHQESFEHHLYLFSNYLTLQSQVEAIRGTLEKLFRWERWPQQAEVDPILSQPYENPFKGVGRNDPCPCGSGKKFKRCCLN
jgi:uncharacterized protein YecA (UPF0149 family)